MKSIMHEASSLSKAIEQGWLKAGQPQEFTIKILEEPQKNFFGFTIKSAKIALFFEDKQTTKHDSRHKYAPAKQKFEREDTRQKEQFFREQTSREPVREKQPRKRFQPEERTEKVTFETQREAVIPEPSSLAKQRQPLWNDEMVNVAQEWLKTTLHIINASSTFTIEPQRWHLRITLSAPLYNDPQKEKHLLASLATLLLETLKRQFKTGLRGHKIVLTHASRNNS